jgi:amidase
MDGFSAAGAFVPHGHVTRPGRHGGTLSGLTVAVKDLFDWAGVPTGAGNPTWLATHPVPTADAAAVAAVSAAGATLYGKTITDEMAYSIHGDNVHYGTPVNTAAPGRVPGGSSSGSAAAVAAGAVDAALGTDTGGSVRVPAAYCGLFGLRTTHELVSREGIVPLSQTFDTVGWFARDAATLKRITEALIPELGATPTKLWRLTEADALTDEATRAAMAAIETRVGLPVEVLPDEVIEAWGGLEKLRQTYVTVQAWDAWQNHRAWIERDHPVFGPAIAKRFEIASKVTDDEATAAREVLEAFRARLRGALGNGVLLLPATAGPAPLIGEDETAVDAVRVKTMRLTSPAGLASLPQITIPILGADGLPRGVGLLGPAHSDRRLCALALKAST